jgi:arsenate reductase
MSEVTIYHNPKCSKSRAALQILEQSGIAPNVIEYLRTPPSADALRAIVAMLGIAPEQLVRKGEQIYRDLYAGKSLSDTQWIDAMVANPILIERPIVVRGKRAVLGRPPENVERLLS